MKFYILTFCLVVFLPVMTHSTVINIPDDQPTIQAGIDAAVNGDTVLIASGTYTGEGNRDLEIQENG